MAQGNGLIIVNERRELINRVAASPYLNRSMRLRELLLYLADRVLSGETGEIHEQEVGHKVFGRPPDYDTASDNIVRVHASTLRKRLAQYFATEGANEPLILEIPKGNYAPSFRERAKVTMASEPAFAEPVPEPRQAPAPSPLVWRSRDAWFWTAVALAIVFAAATITLVLRGTAGPAVTRPNSPVQRFWSQIFGPRLATDVVVDDSAVILYQELTGKRLALSEYFDRSYLRSLENAAQGKLDPQTASNLLLRRQSSYASTSFYSRLTRMPGAGQRQTILRFARDYTFRDLKADNVILLGNASTNPWVQPFEPKLGIRWENDRSAGTYYPVDSSNGGKTYRAGGPGDGREGYFSLAMLPNLGGTGNVLIVSATGGSALNSGADFLSDDVAVLELRGKLPGKQQDAFPYFEALIRMKGRSTLPRDAVIVMCRPLGRG